MTFHFSFSLTQLCCANKSTEGDDDIDDDSASTDKYVSLLFFLRFDKIY
jgi:hypothetical protein